MRSVTVALALVVLVPRGAGADDTKNDTKKRDEDEPVASPTSTALERRELERRPRNRTVNLLQHVPGLAVLTQGGIAPQYFLRGYDAGYGSAIGVEVDGVPLNEGSHGYSHGYSDTGFVIPETVDRLALYEGAYAARYDSFTVAGHLDVRTIDKVAKPVVRLTEGINLGAKNPSSYIARVRPQYRMVGMFSPDLERGSALLAADVGVDDGATIHRQNFRRATMLGKWKRPIGDGELSAIVNFYSGRWFNSGLLSSTAIEEGRLTPLSSADPFQGGIALRTSAQVGYELQDRRGATWNLSAYAVDINHRLYTNPSLFVRDSLRGDQLEYVDSRVYYGFDGFYRRRHRLGPIKGALRIGMQARVDNTTTSTWHDARRLRLVDCFEAINPCTDVAPATRSLGLYAEDRLSITKWLRVFGGVRFEQQTWNVDDRDADTMLGSTTLGGTGSRARISPKVGIVVDSGIAELWLLGGRGVLNTDSRAAVDHNGYGAFVRTYNGEIGTRIRPSDVASVAASAWVSNHFEHTEWLPDYATSSREPQALRYGADWRFTFTPRSWLTFDSGISVARGQLRSGLTRGSLLANAPRFIATSGVAGNWRSTFGSLRVRALGPRAAFGTSHEVDGYALVDLVLGHRWRMLDVNLTVENLLDAAWNEIQVAGIVRTSRRVEVTPDMLVTPGPPRTIWLTLGYTL